MNTCFFALGVLLTVLPTVYLVLAITSTVKFRDRLRNAETASQKSITVMKPLCGDEIELEKNLRSFCTQDYPNYQVIFGVRDPCDVAVCIAERVIQAFPHQDISLVIDDQAMGSNLKVSNLINMAPLAKHEIIVVADADMIVGNDYLKTVSAAFNNDKVGAATCLYCGSSRGGGHGAWR